MTDLEIPFEKDRKGHYRFFEILPGFLSWTLLFTPLILSYINVTAAVFFVFFYLLIFFTRSLAYSTRAIAGYSTMKKHLKLNWAGLNRDLDAGEAVPGERLKRPKWHRKNLRLLHLRKYDIRPNELYHAVIIATVNEGREILEPTIQAVLASGYDPSKLIMVLVRRPLTSTVAFSVMSKRLK